MRRPSYNSNSSSSSGSGFGSGQMIGQMIGLSGKWATACDGAKTLIGMAIKGLRKDCCLPKSQIIRVKEETSIPSMVVGISICPQHKTLGG